VRPGATSTDRADLPAALAAAVQFNCELADARHARERSLCVYLLDMREYYRWAAGLPPGVPPRRDELSRWIAAREQRWDELRRHGEPAFERLPLDGGVDPFDVAAVERRLAASGLVYGAGIGLYGAPLFFLARRHDEQLRDGARVLIADVELARGLVAPPAVSRGGTITIRREALRRWLWTRTETARRGAADSAFGAALRAYGDPDDPGPALERMTSAETETLILHELGELRAAALLGPDWEEMLAGVGDPRTERLVRAVRDLCADCLVTLPTLIEREAEPSLLFWLAGFDGLRRVLAPELAAAWGASPRRLDRDALERAARRGREIWVELAAELLASWRRGGAGALAERAARLAPAL
jgi:hypothetical protein